jgi:hypothetical protein
MPRSALFTAVCLALFAVAPAAAGSSPDAPDDFPRFVFAGREKEAELLSRYLWHHFHHRAGNPLVLFNKEYLLVADMWMAGARERGSGRSIQEIHRDHLLAAQMDEEGYVLTHQHFSHAHDHGWPFPLWTQSEVGPDRVRGITAGWHFQEMDRVRGWVQGYVKGWKAEEYCGARAASLWEAERAKSLGIVEDAWRLEATGPSPSITTPEGFSIDAFNAPFLQLRWSRSGEPKDHALPYIEWRREGDGAFDPERRMYFAPERTPLSTRHRHSIIAVHRHPLWKGKIERIRISLAPGETAATFDIDSFFTVYDTRHTINNPIFILASWRYFAWTGDIDFLRRNMNRMRLALRHQQTVMGALEHLHIRNPWPGHDGLAGFVRNPDGSKTIRGGHGIGNNYWDLIPFGGDDFYATYQYYAAARAMVDLEQAARDRPDWGVPLGALALDPEGLRGHARAVKKRANELFWNESTGRFYASIDVEGRAYDYGFTFVNLDAIWYGIASDEHARSILAWLDGERIVEGDTSTGADIYHWRFGPRATTRRNIEWYGQGWHGPETIAWGGQIQDGGAVLGFSFYDLWARLSVLGAESAWKRLEAILAWEEDVWREGGYRAYYEGGRRGTTLQGGGTAGGIGVDHEFFESSLLPSIVTHGFLGLDPAPEGLRIRPRLPESCPEMGVRNLLYRRARMHVTASPDGITIELRDAPAGGMPVILGEEWSLEGAERKAGAFLLTRPGEHRFARRRT